MKKVTLFALLVLSLALSVAGCGKKTTEERATEISDHIAKSLELTDVQRRKVDIIKNDILNKRTEIYNKQMRDQIQYELTSQLNREKFSPEQFGEFKDKTLKRQDEFVTYLGDRFAEFHSILSPPQREKLAQDLARNKDKWFGDR